MAVLLILRGPIYTVLALLDFEFSLELLETYRAFSFALIWLLSYRVITFAFLWHLFIVIQSLRWCGYILSAGIFCYGGLHCYFSSIYIVCLFVIKNVIGLFIIIYSAIFCWFFLSLWGSKSDHCVSFTCTFLMVGCTSLGWCGCHVNPQIYLPSDLFVVLPKWKFVQMPLSHTRRSAYAWDVSMSLPITSGP